MTKMTFLFGSDQCSRGVTEMVSLDLAPNILAIRIAVAAIELIAESL